jgi:HK97 family phage portal protein
MNFVDNVLSAFGLERRSLNDPSVPLSEAYDLLALPTAAGVSVTPENAMGHAAVFAAVRVLSSTIATLPLHVYRHSDDNGGKARLRRHPVNRLLSGPAPDMNGFQWKELTVVWLAMYGAAYYEIEYDGASRPIALWPIHPKLVTVERTKSGRKIYKVQVESDEIILKSDRVLHIPGMSADGLDGLSPLMTGKEAVGHAKAVDEYSSRFFQNSATPPLALRHPGKLTPVAKQNLKTSIQKENGGLQNAHRIFILEEGISIDRLAVDPDNSQLLQSRQYSVLDVSRLLGVPPALLGDLTNGTYSNTEQQSLSFLTLSIEPLTRRIEAALNATLFGQDSDAFVEFKLDGLLRADVATRTQAYRTLYEIGVLSVNEIRARENMPSIEGGDTHYFASNNLQPVTAEMQPVTEPVTEAARSLIAAELGRYARRKAKHEQRGNVDAEWLDAQRAILTENLTDTLQAYFDLTERKQTPEEFINAVLADPDTEF